MFIIQKTSIVLRNAPRGRCAPPPLAGEVGSERSETARGFAPTAQRACPLPIPSAVNAPAREHGPPAWRRHDDRSRRRPRRHHDEGRAGDRGGPHGGAGHRSGADAGRQRADPAARLVELPSQAAASASSATTNRLPRDRSHRDHRRDAHAGRARRARQFARRRHSRARHARAGHRGAHADRSGVLRRGGALRRVPSGGAAEMDQPAEPQGARLCRPR